MAAIRPRDLLSDSLLERLGGTWAETSQAPGDVAAALRLDIAKLGDLGYLHGALCAAGQGAGYAAGGGGPQTAAGDLQFAAPGSRCEPAGESGYRFRDTEVLSSLTPAWDWLAVHAVHA